jgi:thiol:disulfide interchange protein DsbD
VEEPTATPGSQVKVGIQFVTDSGWHIYWRNPGDSGEPPRMQWQLPKGVTAGELEWPTPMRMTTTAGTDFGYQGTTVLLTTLRLPVTPLSGTISVGGELRWLVCRDICVPQSAHLEVPVRIASAAGIDEPSRQLLESAAERLPTPLPASCRIEAASLPDRFRLTLVTGPMTSGPITRVEFFPAEEAEIDNGAAQEWTNHAGKVSLTLKKSEYLRQEPEHLRGVLALNGREAYLVDAPVHNSTIQRPAIQEGNHQR